VFERDNVLFARTPYMSLQPGEFYTERLVRFRTVGDATCTGAAESSAATIEHIIAETAAARTTERGTRNDDKRSEAAMEDRKKQGYF
jgi:sulfate adenylyltransferase subunit 2